MRTHHYPSHHPILLSSVRWLSVTLFSAMLLPPFIVEPADAQFDVPVRLTFNSVEDRTTTGSIAHDCGFSAAVWMQAQAGPGWRLMWAVDDGVGWSTPDPINATQHEDYDPRIMTTFPSAGDIHAVWQRQSGTEAEIMYGTRPFSHAWSVEPITVNTTEDLTPDIATRFDGRIHVTWVGFDEKSGEGRIFYARKNTLPPQPWMVEMVPISDLGPFWTGAAPKVELSPFDDVIHIVYRGGDFGSYRTHYARRDIKGIWTFQALTTPNAEDLVADVTGYINFLSNAVTVAMSGNDCFGCPSRVYVRRSTDLGLTFGEAELVSGSHSAELGALGSGNFDDVAVVAAELSGNIFTGDLLLSRDLDLLSPETLPPATQSSYFPSLAQTTCFRRGELNLSGLGMAFTNLGSAKAPFDSAEVWVIRGRDPGLAVNDPPHAPAARLAVTASPNPFSSSTMITATSLVPGSNVELAIYDSLGRLVRRFTEASPGTSSSQSWRWDGQDAAGRPAASGIFFVEMKQGPARAIDRLIRIR